MSKSRFVGLIERIVAAAGKEEEFKTEDHFSIRIPNAPYMDLCIESWPNPLQEGRLISVAHYYIQNGDACPDPFLEVMDTGWPVSITQWTGQQVITWKDETGQVVYKPGAKKDVSQFMTHWASNLRNQGFVEAAKKLIEQVMA